MEFRKNASFCQSMVPEFQCEPDFCLYAGKINEHTTGTCQLCMKEAQNGQTQHHNPQLPTPPREIHQIRPGGQTTNEYSGNVGRQGMADMGMTSMGGQSMSAIVMPNYQGMGRTTNTHQMSQQFSHNESSYQPPPLLQGPNNAGSYYDNPQQNLGLLNQPMNNSQPTAGQYQSENSYREFSHSAPGNILGQYQTQQNIRQITQQAGQQNHENQQYNIDPALRQHDYTSAAGGQQTQYGYSSGLQNSNFCSPEQGNAEAPGDGYSPMEFNNGVVFTDEELFQMEQSLANDFDSMDFPDYSHDLTFSPTQTIGSPPAVFSSSPAYSMPLPSAPPGPDYTAASRQSSYRLSYSAPTVPQNSPAAGSPFLMATSLESRSTPVVSTDSPQGRLPPSISILPAKYSSDIADGGSMLPRSSYRGMGARPAASMVDLKQGNERPTSSSGNQAQGQNFAYSFPSSSFPMPRVTANGTPTDAAVEARKERVRNDELL